MAHVTPFSSRQESVGTRVFVHGWLVCGPAERSDVGGGISRQTPLQVIQIVDPGEVAVQLPTEQCKSGRIRSFSRRPNLMGLIGSIRPSR